MELGKNPHRLYKGECWSLVIFFFSFFSLAQVVGPSHALATVNSHGVKGNDDILMNFPKALIVEKKCRLAAFNIDNINTSVGIPLLSKETENCIFEVYLNSTSISSLLEQERSTEYNFYLKSVLDNVRDVAYDFINNKLYILTKNNKVESDKLIVVDMISGYTGIAIADLNLPKNVEVDPSTGLLFILQQSSILRANMDGSSRVKLIEKTGISRIAIDRISKRIYWATATKIESSGYHYTSQRIVATVARPIRGLAVLRNELFWLSAPHGFTKPTTTITRCKLDCSHVCDPKTIDTIPFDNPHAIKTYDYKELQETITNKSNPCKNQPIPCEHFCLLKVDGYSCACNVGYKLNSDGRTCQLANDEFLLFVQNKHAKGRIIRSETRDLFNFVDAIYPVALESDAEVLSFDYDYQNNYIYFTDNSPGNNKLFAKKLDGSQEQIDMFSYKGAQVLSTATDWVSKNVYQLVSQNTPRHKCVVMVHRYPEIMDEITKLGPSTKLLELPAFWDAGSIVVHPNRGQFFISIDQNNDGIERSIYTGNLDGSNFTIFVYDVSLYGLTIDFEDETLYWIHDDRKTLMSYDLDGLSEIRTTNISAVSNPTSVSINGEYAYVGNSSSIWRFDKTTGSNPQKLVESADTGHPKTIIGTKIYKESAQPFFDGHPCLVDNGGCQKFCYPVPSGEKWSDHEKPKLRRLCGCEKGEQLSLDGLTCGPTNALPKL